MGQAQLDDRDCTIIADRVAQLDGQPRVRVGDYVDFADGVTRRVSHVYEAASECDLQASVQTSDDGSFYLDSGRVTFSGSLYPGVPTEALTLTRERRRGRIWIFHHDRWGAYNRVSSQIEFRVFACARPAPR